MLVLGILTCAYKGVRNVSFPENLACVPDGWSLTYQSKLYFHFFFHFEVPKKILVFFQKWKQNVNSMFWDRRNTICFFLSLKHHVTIAALCLLYDFHIYNFKNFANFTGKHLCWSLFLIKFLRNFIKDTPTQVCWSVKFAKFLRTSFFYRLPAVAASEWTLPSIERLCNNKNQHDFLLISCVF